MLPSVAKGMGGVILPDLHYGSDDALVGAALILQHLANTGIKLSEWELRWVWTSQS